MTQFVLHRGKTLLGACSVAAIMVFSQAASGAGMGAMGGGMRAGGMTMQPPVTTAPHPFDPSGHLPVVSPSGSLQPPVTTAPHPFDPSGHMPGVSGGSPPPITRMPVTGSRIPVTTIRQQPETNATVPVTEDQRPVVARHLYTPGGDLIAPPGVSSNKPVTSDGTRPVVDDQKPVVARRLFTPDQGSPPVVDEQRPTVARHLYTPGGEPTVPTKVGGDPTTGTQIVDSPIK